MTDLGWASDAIRRWGESRDWRGWDPYDALNSPFAQVLTFGTTFGRRVLTQAVKRSPLNLRIVLRIPPDWNAKAIALVASGYARLGAARDDDTARISARRWLDWLLDNAYQGGGGLAWGYHFDVCTRFFGYPRGTPNTIATSFAAHALLDGHEFLGDGRYGDGALRAVGFLHESMLERKHRVPYFRYLQSERELVHNANLLACSVVLRTATLTGGSLDDGVVVDAVRTSVDAQLDDGSWPYAEGPAGAWVDNFHTGYVLEALGYCKTADEGVRVALERGFDFWERELFLADGTPKYSPSSVYPLDAHNYAQAVETWLSAAEWRDDAFKRASRCALLLVERMLNPKGYVNFQRSRFWTSSIPFIRWTTAPTFKALARLELGHTC